MSDRPSEPTSSSDDSTKDSARPEREERDAGQGDGPQTDRGQETHSAKRASHVAFVVRVIKSLKRVGRRVLRPIVDFDLRERQRESAAELSELDSLTNREGMLPEGEQVALRSIWVVEVFPPSLTAKVLPALRRLGWLERRFGSHPHAVDRWLNDRGGLPGGVAYYPLGPVRKTSEADSFAVRVMGQLNAILPDNIAYAYASLIRPLPSTTVLVMQFCFDEASASALERPFRRTYGTKVQRVKGGFQYSMPYHQRIDDAAEIRTRLRRGCIDWMRDNVPGLFAAKETTNAYPTCEFITFKQRQPYEPVETGELHSYADCLRMDSPYDVYATDDGTIRWAPPDERSAEPNASIVAGRVGELLAEPPAPGGSKWDEKSLPLILKELAPSIGLWALHCTLNAWEQDVGTLRDEVAQIALHRHKRALSELRNAERLRARLARDALPFASDLLELSEKRHAFFFCVQKFFELKPLGQGRAEYFEQLRKGLPYRIRTLELREAQVRAQMQTVSSLLVAESNERLARSNVRIQWLVLLATILIGYITLGKERVLSWLGSLVNLR